MNHLKKIKFAFVDENNWKKNNRIEVICVKYNKNTRLSKQIFRISFRDALRNLVYNELIKVHKVDFLVSILCFPRYRFCPAPHHRGQARAPPHFLSHAHYTQRKPPQSIIHPYNPSSQSFRASRSRCFHTSRSNVSLSTSSTRPPCDPSSLVPRRQDASSFRADDKCEEWLFDFVAHVDGEGSGRTSGGNNDYQVISGGGVCLSRSDFAVVVVCCARER